MHRERQDPPGERRRPSTAKKRDRILKCPFCERALSGTTPIDTPLGDTVDGGFCPCGAVFIYDRSGKRQGEAYMDALALAYNWDYEAAVSGGGEGNEGFEEASIRYDAKVQMFFDDQGGRSTRDPQFYFIKRKRTASEPPQEGQPGGD